jgi:hypothetical protein
MTGRADRRRRKGLHATLVLNAQATRVIPRCRRAYRDRHDERRAGAASPADAIREHGGNVDTLAPEMAASAGGAIKLWLFKPLLLREFEKSGPTEAMVRTTTALTIFNAGDKDNVLPGNAAATVNFPHARRANQCLRPCADHHQ